MRNLIKEKPTDPLRPRQIESIRFVDSSDIKNKTILDVGCGYGWFVNYAVLNGAKKVCGIEIEESDFSSAVKTIKHKNVEFKIGSGLEIPYDNESFDTVVCWEVIEHIPKGTEKKFFKEISRVLKAGGVFYLSTPYDSFFSKYLDPAWWLLGHRHYSKKKLASTGTNQLKAIEIMTRGKVWSLLLLLNFYASKWILRRNALFNSFFDAREKREYEKSSGFMQVFAKYTKTKKREK